MTHVGSSLDDFLRQEGILEQATEEAIAKVTKQLETWFPAGATAFLPCYGDGSGEVGKILRTWYWDDEALDHPSWMVEIDDENALTSGEVASAYVAGTWVSNVEIPDIYWIVAGFDIKQKVALLSGPLPCRSIKLQPLTGFGKRWKKVSPPVRKDAP